jgi:hypothetical protein
MQSTRSASCRTRAPSETSRSVRAWGRFGDDAALGAVAFSLSQMRCPSSAGTSERMRPNNPRRKGTRRESGPAKAGAPLDATPTWGENAR